jgi:hypothetical protein
MLNFKSKIITTIYILVILTFLFPFCNSSATNFCKKDDDCDELNFCNINDNKCVHKKIFSDLSREFTGLLMIVLGSALSNAGGIGGGGLLIPILLLILNFYTHEAIPISKLMIFTGALTSFYLGFRQKHPMRNSITIDYNIPLLLVPMLLFGTMVGVTLNKVTPPWLILISLTAVLILNTYKTLKKGVKLYKEEKDKLGEIRELSVTDKNSVKVVDGILNDNSKNFSRVKEYKASRDNNKYNKEYYDFELNSGKIIKNFIILNR